MDGQAKASPRRPLAAMLSHAARYSPYYRDQEWASRLRAGEEIKFRDIPITPKALVRTETGRFYGSFVPPEHGKVLDKPTSGSTGEPMLLRKTSLHFKHNSMENSRLRVGWGFDDHKRMVQVALPNDAHPIGTMEEENLPGGEHNWKLYTAESRATYELFRRSAATRAWGYPSLICAALAHAAEASEILPLRLIATVAEVVPVELRALVGQIPDCRLMDTYGCTESGLIAVQCPDCNAYHPADRHLALELLDDDDRRVGPGDMGRVIVTPFFNAAMPLVRYETGDYVVLADSNACSRSPVAIKRIVGRERNLFKLPDGRRVYPRMPQSIVTKIPWRQFKLIQRTITDVELHYVPKDETAHIPEEQAQDMVDRYMAPGFRVRCVRVMELPRAANGKFLSHECFV